jgi:WD40 repeat protein
MAPQNVDAVVVWDTATGKIVATPTVPHNNDVTLLGFGVAFSPDGTRLAASSVPTPKELWILSTDDWTPMAQYQVPATTETNEAPSKNLLVTPDGEILIGTDFAPVGEGRIVFMDGTTLEYLGQISDAHVGVADLSLNAEGTLLASAGGDGFVRVWDVQTRALVHQIPVGEDAGGVAFMENGQYLSVTSKAHGELRLVTIDTDELLEIARSRVTRTFTETECTTYRIDPCPTLEDIRAG